MATEESPSERRMAENEIVFRESNARIIHWFSRFKRYVQKESDTSDHLRADTVISFFCECSDENCKQRINIPLTTYKKIHKQADHFTIACGHHVPAIEDVVLENSEYCVVKKHWLPPQPSSGTLNATNVDNT